MCVGGEVEGAAATQWNVRCTFEVGLLVVRGRWVEGGSDEEAPSHLLSSVLGCVYVP